MSTRAIDEAQIIVENEYASYPNASPSALAAGLKSLVLVPILVNGVAVTLVNVVKNEPDHFTPERVRFLTAVAYGVGVMLEKARLDEERQKAEEVIRASLAEKEVMLKEINHRVKNNLQIISSLLSLQGRDIDNTLAQEYFRISQDRIKAMALVHEKLYQSEDLARIDFGEYLRTLTEDLHNSYGIGSQNVDLDIKVETMLLGVDAAIPCGLIVNELISNSLKHAFPDKRSGRITVQAHSFNGSHTMVVKDNGVGLPSDLDIRSAKTLGLTIINALSGQIGGTVEIEQDDGAQFRITFPAETAR